MLTLCDAICLTFWSMFDLVSPSCGSMVGFFSHDEEVDCLGLSEAYLFVHVDGWGVVGSDEEADYAVFPG